jgi:DNA-binding NtrC family response regulator
MLPNAGFSVIEASDGSAALDVIQARENRIDVLLLDISLPGISSRAVFERAKLLRPDMTVVITSAYSQDMASASLAGKAEYFIRKPFEISRLVDLLRKTHGG